ncbi:MAG TPA: type II toxin-antitoxin system VapC family toxin [Solirubrobacterales bacterium]|nr:type II toxin-antitoxin system VapC family toxin [Solirubrobacterales bacterium]
MPATPAQSDLLAYALFDLDPRVRGLRQPLHIFLASLAIFELGRAANRKEILKLCNEQFLSDNGISAQQLEAAIAAGREVGLFVLSNDLVDISQDRKAQLAAASGRISTQREAFHREITSSIHSETGEVLMPIEQDELRDALEGFIQRLFQEKSVALARSFGPEGNGFDEDTVEHLSTKSLDSIARAVTPAREKLRRAQISEGIRNGLLSLSIEGQKYLAAVYQKTVAFALLEQDPVIRKVKRELAKERVCYLDTNVVMALLFSAHPQHEVATTAVEAARQVGCKLVVSPYTIEELERQLKESDQNYRRLKAHGDLLHIADDDALRTYAEQRTRVAGLTWTAFLATYSPPTEFLDDQQIQTIQDDAAAAHHDDRRERVREAIAGSKARYTHPKIIDVDTDNFLVVQLQRKRRPADEMGNQVWLITLDRSLRDADRMLIKQKVYRVPSSKRLWAWTADLSPFLSPDDHDLGEYALHLVQSQLGLLAEDPVFADINFLSTLEESQFDVEALLKGSRRQARRVLVALQEEREVKEVLGEKPENPDEREPWADRLAEVVERTLKKLEFDSEQEARFEMIESERDAALRQASAAKRQRDRSRRKIAALQQQVELQSMHRSGAWARFVAWFRRR